MAPELHNALQAHRVMCQYVAPNDYVFASSTGRPANPDMLRDNLQTVLRDKMNIHLGPREDGLHLLRHTSGSLVYRSTASVKMTQAWLGYSSSRVTMDTYTHLMGESQQTAVDAVFSRPAVEAVARKGQN